MITRSADTDLQNSTLLMGLRSKTNAKTGCLFDVLEDPGEHVDLALTMPAKATEIYAKMVEAEKHWFNPDRGAPDAHACAIAKSSGYWQPFLP